MACAREGKGSLWKMEYEANPQKNEPPESLPRLVSHEGGNLFAPLKSIDFFQIRSVFIFSASSNNASRILFRTAASCFFRNFATSLSNINVYTIRHGRHHQKLCIYHP